jgi:hypothetical protein
MTCLVPHQWCIKYSIFVQLFAIHGQILDASSNRAAPWKYELRKRRIYAIRIIDATGFIVAVIIAAPQCSARTWAVLQ